ncbi:hypothetical protein IMG5_182280, partial [Ichthyophthirius multifiliis]
ANVKERKVNLEQDKKHIFCTYLEYFIKNLKEKNASESSENLYNLINNDENFSQSLVLYVKELAVHFINESDPLYIKFLLQISEMETVQDLINHIRSNQEPLEITFKIISSSIETQINVHSLQGNQIVENQYKINSLSKPSGVSIDLFKGFSESQSIYGLFYTSQECSGFEVQKNMKQKSINNKQILKKNNQVDDFKQRTSFLKKLIKAFDENTEELIYKFNYFTNGQNENIEEEENNNEKNINIQQNEKGFKEQINNSKSRTLNFYSNIQNQERSINWLAENTNPYNNN